MHSGADFYPVGSINRPMKLGTIAKYLITASAVMLLNSCLVQEKVTRNGEVIKEDYTVKRPLKGAMENSN